MSGNGLENDLIVKVNMKGINKMICKRYRIGRKVGVLCFDANSNKDVIESGRIIARKREPVFHERRSTEWRYKYAVRLKSGEILICTSDVLWTKHEKE